MALIVTDTFGFPPPPSRNLFLQDLSRSHVYPVVERKGCSRQQSASTIVTRKLRTGLPARPRMGCFPDN
jgi:hypothetical protein